MPAWQYRLAWKLLLASLLVFILGLAGCGGSYPTPTKPPSSNVSVNVSVNPSSIAVAAGSTTQFTVSFTPSLPEGGSLSWSVNPPKGGTITNAGVYTASGTAGKYTVFATWTPSNPAAGAIYRGSAAIKVLPPPQLEAELNTDLVQASGTNQVFGAIKNAAVVGQVVPFVISADHPTNRTQVRSGFAIPLVCKESRKSCQ